MYWGVLLYPKFSIFMPYIQIISDSTGIITSGVENKGAKMFH